jgi:hypothetical protein
MKIMMAENKLPTRRAADEANDGFSPLPAHAGEKVDETIPADQTTLGGSSVSDMCKIEYWSSRPLWQSDLDYFAAQGISGLDLANPDPVLKAGIILEGGGATFIFEHHTDTDEGRDAFILPVSGGGITDLVAYDPEIGLLATWLGRAFAINEASIWEPNLDGNPLPVWRDPIGWLKAKRQGIVLLRPEQAYSYLDHLPGVIAEDVQHGEELERLLWTPRRKVSVFLRDTNERRAAA